jgi:hypothetical protein
VESAVFLVSSAQQVPVALADQVGNLVLQDLQDPQDLQVRQGLRVPQVLVEKLVRLVFLEFQGLTQSFLVLADQVETQDHRGQVETQDHRGQVGNLVLQVLQDLVVLKGLRVLVVYLELKDHLVHRDLKV